MTESIESHPRVQRVQPRAVVLETSIANFQRKLTSELEKASHLAQAHLRHLANVTAPLRSIIQQNPTAAASLAELQKTTTRDHVLASVRTRRGAEPLGTYSFTANRGFQIFGPPYDLDWCNQSASLPFSGADRNTGQIRALSYDGPFSAAVGVFLSASEKSLTRVAPFAPFHYVWSGLDYNAPASVRGLVGVAVYVNQDPQPLLDYSSELWNAHFSFPGHRGDGSGSSTVSRELPREVLIPMDPGNSYLVWVWCAVISHSVAVVDDTASGGTGGWGEGTIDCDVPFIVVDAGPPVYLR